ncbi:DNA-directed RNA polymerase subunit omega [Actinomyces sp. 2119]|uniref:DNA-directed RNA polymerase subunit omega n=1 Tax=Actinomyces lilanjuaniae TaxID=2321394 RepID=A0ABN5PS52_9ACTO|nr:MULTISPECIES: DNA-directed RNA polymerase subunit omega [Actinomyces]AYD89767.1 DNA-directed RNA polymerase subunit omega [Actinomyces lilanjuaniae]RJF44740.1 DNA-directed RNA polymerase subunit omega [Actinomyces sp. 2119]
MLGTSPQPEGITNPPIDDLLDKVDSKYGLVVEAAKRARQINAYTQQLEDNQMEFFGPLVEAELEEKSLGIALREIAEDKLEVIPGDVARARRAEAEEARRAAEADMFADIDLGTPVSMTEVSMTETEDLDAGDVTGLEDIQF